MKYVICSILSMYICFWPNMTTVDMCYILELSSIVWKMLKKKKKSLKASGY